MANTKKITLKKHQQQNLDSDNQSDSETSEFQSDNENQTRTLQRQLRKWQDKGQFKPVTGQTSFQNYNFQMGAKKLPLQASETDREAFEWKKVGDIWICQCENSNKIGAIWNASRRVKCNQAEKILFLDPKLNCNEVRTTQKSKR